MKEGYIALIDSGVGGLSLLFELLKIMPGENYIYYGDNDNAPYGNKHLRNLMELTKRNIDAIKQYKIKVLAVACNTLSVNLFNEIKDYSGLEVFGVFPPVETASILGDSLLLATELTAKKFSKMEIFNCGRRIKSYNLVDCLSVVELFVSKTELIS